MEEKNAPIGDYLCDVPINTTEDFVNLMKKIQDLNLTVGNKKVYPFGYVGSDCWTSLALLGGEMMGYRGHFYTSSWDPVNKKNTPADFGAYRKSGGKAAGADDLR